MGTVASATAAFAVVASLCSSLKAFERGRERERLKVAVGMPMPHNDDVDLCC